MAFAAETICVQGSNERKDPFGAISMPIYQNAAYAHPGLGKSTGYDYSRCSNPTRDEVQKTVALLEQGTEALAFSTGMAAITAMMEIFSPGDHLIATDDLYGGTLRLWNTISHKNGISVDCGYFKCGDRESGVAPGDKSYLSGDTVQSDDESSGYSGNCRSCA